MQAGEFNLAQFLSDQGMELSRMDASGNPIVKTPSGQEMAMELPRFLEDHGIDPKASKIIYNTPEKAIPYSPLSTAERAAWSFGDPGSKEKFLKSRFEGLQTDTEKGLVVNDGGVWKQVDPSFFGNADAWETAKAIGKVALSGSLAGAFVDPTAEMARSGGKEILSQAGKAIKGAKESLSRPNWTEEAIKDLAESGPTVIKGIGETVGAATGAATLNPANAVIGAGVGGAIGSRIVTSLGRVIGTYQSDPGTELGENMLDGLFSMAGQSIAAGSRPMVRNFDDMVSSINKTATDGVKDRIASLFSVTKQTDESAARFLLHNTDDYIAARKDIVSKVGSSAKDVLAEANRQKFQGAVDLVKEASAKLNSNFGRNLESLFTAAEQKGVKIDMEEALTPALKQIQDLGVGSFKEVNGKPVFQFFDNAARARLEKQGVTNVNLVPDEIKAPMQQMISSVLDRAQLGEMQGKPAAQILRKIEAEINQVTGANVSEGAKDILDAMLLKVSSAIKNGTGQTFDKAGLNQEYTTLLQSYSAKKNAVNFGQKLLRQDNGPAALADALVQNSGKKVRAEGYAKDLISLLGDRGEELYNDMMAAHTVGNLAPWFRGNLISTLGAGGAATFAATGKASLGATVPVVAQAFSPRFQATEVVASRKMLQMLQSLTPDVRKNILQNDAAFDAVVRPVFESGMKSALGAQQLLQSSGVLDGQQQ
jgi:hypothetical protein